MKVTAEQKKHYDDKGWVVIEGVFPVDVVERLAQLGLDIIAPDVKEETGSYKVDRSPDGKELAPRKLDTPFERDLAFGRAVYDSPLPSLIEQLTGVPPL